MKALVRGTRISKRFVVRRTLGAGRFGTVYAAQDRKLRRNVAIKMMAPEYIESVAVRAFLREARTAARLPHPNIVVTHDVRLAKQVVGPTGQMHEDLTAVPILVTELLSGTPLRFAQNRPLADTLDWMAQLSSAVAYAHEAGVAHRGLSPSNILVDGEGLKVLDFGLAESLHRARGTLRTPESETGKADDIYAIGLIMFELLTGRRPSFDAESQDLPLRPGAIVQDLPEAIDDLVYRCLSVKPSERPEDGPALVTEILRVQASITRPRTSTRTTEECPFPGLVPFDEPQARYFFGRGEEIRACLECLGRTRLGPRRWLSLEGPSGAGKSSLLQGGLIPAIRKGWILDGPKRWRIAKFRPGADVLTRLRDALTEAFRTPLQPSGSAVPPEGSPTTMPTSAAWESGTPSAGEDIEGPIGTLIDAQSRLRSGEGLILVIDQLEELFTLHKASDPRVEQFDRDLGHQVMQPENEVYILTTIRSDFLDGLRRLAWLGSLLNTHASRYVLPALSPAALREIIAAPVSLTGLQWSKAVIDRIVTDAGQQVGNLPLVAHLLRTLWQAHRNDHVDVETYERHGGLVGALTQSADRRIDELDDAGQERAQRLLLALVSTGRGVPDTRRTLSKEAALAAAGSGPKAEQVLMTLSGMHDYTAVRLVVIRTDKTKTYVDLAHEALLRDWPRLKRWVQEARRGLERRDDLEAAAQAWVGAGRPPGGLPRGGQLAYFRDAQDVGELAREFLDAAENQSVQALRTDLRTRRRRVGGLTVGVVVVFGLAIWGLYERHLVEQQRKKALSIANELVEKVDPPLGFVPNARDARKALLQASASLLSILEARGGYDRQTRINLLLTHSRRAQLYLTTDGVGAALKEAEAVIALYQGLQQEGLREESAILHQSLNRVAWIVYLAGRQHEARVWVERAVALAKQARAEGAAGSIKRSGVVWSQSFWAFVAVTAGTTREANRIMQMAYQESVHLQAQGQYRPRLRAWVNGIGHHVDSAHGRFREAYARLQDTWLISRQAMSARPDAPQAIRDTALAEATLGRLELALGDPERARDYLTVSLQDFARTEAADPERTYYSNERIVAQLYLGIAYGELRDNASARERLHTALMRLTPEIERSQSAELRTHWANGVYALGNLALAEEDRVAAEHLHQMAYAHRHGLHDAAPGATVWVMELAQSEMMLGHIAYRGGDLKGAGAYYTKAFDRITEVTERDPGRYSAHVIGLEAMRSLVDVYAASGRVAQAQALAQEAARQLDRLIAQNPVYRRLWRWKWGQMRPGE